MANPSPDFGGFGLKARGLKHLQFKQLIGMMSTLYAHDVEIHGRGHRRQQQQEQRLGPTRALDFSHLDSSHFCSQLWLLLSFEQSSNSSMRPPSLCLVRDAYVESMQVPARRLTVTW